MELPKTGFTVTGEYHSCFCVGPQNGQPLCPCLMKSVVIKDGHYVIPEKKLGPAVCGIHKQGEFDMLICVRSHGHSGDCNFVVKR